MIRGRSRLVRVVRERFPLGSDHKLVLQERRAMAADLRGKQVLFYRLIRIDGTPYKSNTVTVLADFDSLQEADEALLDW